MRKLTKEEAINVVVSMQHAFNTSNTRLCHCLALHIDSIYWNTNTRCDLQMKYISCIHFHTEIDYCLQQLFEEDGYILVKNFINKFE